MKIVLSLLAALLAASLHAAPAAPASVPAAVAIDTKLLSALAAADDERQAATKAADRGRLAAIFSDELRYAHSSGKVDSKASYTESLVSGQTVYESFEYKERTFLPVAPGVALMSGRVLVHSRNNGQSVALDLNFLAVWREEQGHWRFLAWQSCRNNPAPAPVVK